MSVKNEGKQRLLTNVVSNFLYVAVNSLVIVLLTPYLVRNLGIELYGLIPLVISFIAYFNLITMSMASSLNRYVTLQYHKLNFVKCNTYINSALWPLIIINVLLMIPVLLISFNVSSFINVPPGSEKQVSMLFVLIISGAFVTSISAPFMVGVYVKHRFDLENIVKLLAKIIQVSLILVLFETSGASIDLYGLSYLAMTLSTLVLMYYLQRKLAPELFVNYKLFSKSHMLEMSNLSFWTLINQIGSILYITVAILLVNVLLGSELGGKYAAIAQWVALLGVLGGSISSVFIPIAYEYIAKNDMVALVKQMSRSIKYITLIIGFPVSFLSGFSRPILGVWLGDEFVELSILMWVMLMPWVVTIGVRPLFAVFTGMNKVLIPAIVTLGVGVINVFLIYVLVVVYNYGLIGVAFSLLICFTAKNLLFTTIYSAVITKQKKMKYIIELVPGILMSILFSISFYYISLIVNMESLLMLAFVCVISGMVYVAMAYFMFVNKIDRDMFIKLFSNFIHRNKLDDV